MNVIALTRVRVPYFVVYTKTIVLFGSLEIVCMEWDPKSYSNCHFTNTCEVYMYVHALAHVKALYSYTLLLDYETLEHECVVVYTKRTVLLRFGSLEIVWKWICTLIKVLYRGMKLLRDKDNLLTMDEGPTPMCPLFRCSTVLHLAGPFPSISYISTSLIAH